MTLPNNNVFHRFAPRNWSLRLKIAVATAILLAAVVITTITIFVRNQRALLLATAKQHSRDMLSTVIAASADKLYFLDSAYLRGLARNIAQSDEILNVRIVDPQAQVLADANNDTLRFTNITDPFGQQLLQTSDPVFVIEGEQVTSGQSVRVGNQTFGAVSITTSIVAIQQQIRAVQWQAFWIGLIIMVLGSVLAWLVARSLTRPFETLIAATSTMARGDLAQRLQLNRGDEFATFAQSFNHMADAIQERETHAQTLNQTLNDRATELEKIVRDLREANAARDALSQTVRALVNPVIPITKGVLVLPLVGEIDNERAQQISETLLDAVTTTRARYVILDVTGVQLIDTHIAQVLIRLAQAVKLLGAKALMSGIRPEIADTIVHLGINFRDLATYADLQSAFKATMATAEPSIHGFKI